MGFQDFLKGYAKIFGPIMIGLICSWCFVVFLISLSAYFGWLYFRPIVFYIILLCTYLDRVKKEGFKYRAAFTKKIFHMSWFVRYLATLTAISTVANLLYAVQQL